MQNDFGPVQIVLDRKQHLDTVQNGIFISEKLFFGPVRNGPKLLEQFQNRFRLLGQGISFLIHKIKIEKLRKEQKQLLDDRLENGWEDEQLSSDHQEAEEEE